MINEYFDGDLEGPNQEVLFGEIAKNEDLRYDFNQLFAMKMAIGKDTAAFVPRTESADAIFSSLGIASVSSSKFGFLTNNKKQIYTGILTTLATILIMLWLLKWGNSEYNANIPVVSSISMDAPSLTMEIPVEKIDAINQDKAIVERAISQDYKTIIAHNNNLNTHLDMLALDNKKLRADNRSIRNSYAQLAEQNNLENNNSISTNNELLNSEYNSVFESNFVQTPNSLLSKNGNNYIFNNSGVYNPETSIKLEAAVGRYFQNIGTDFIERNNTFSDNLRLTGLYNLSREYSIGLDLRQENFYQEFTDINQSGNKVLYQQQPVVYSGSLIFRYSPQFIEFLNVKPNIDLSVGITNIGELARIGFGVDYYLFGNTYFYFKSDYTFLSYYHKNINFSSNKFGTHVGVGIEF